MSECLFLIFCETIEMGKYFADLPKNMLKKTVCFSLNFRDYWEQLKIVIGTAQQAEKTKNVIGTADSYHKTTMKKISESCF